MRAVIRHRTVPYGYSLVASTNSAASIHLPVPVITDPQRAQGLTWILARNFLKCRAGAHGERGCGIPRFTAGFFPLSQQFRLRIPNRITGCAVTHPTRLRCAQHHRVWRGGSRKHLPLPFASHPAEKALSSRLRLARCNALRHQFAGTPSRTEVQSESSGNVRHPAIRSPPGTNAGRTKLPRSVNPGGP